MNVLTRGMRGALRSPLRSGGVVLMLAVSICLILAMMVARSSVNAKIDEVKATVATKITINPAGVSGGFGGGDPLTSEQIDTVEKTDHVSSVTTTLTDHLSSSDTDLEPSFELGGIGQRIMRFESGSSTNAETPDDVPQMPAPKPRTVVTGTNDPRSIVTSDDLTSGSMIDGDSSDNIALVGKALAEKNDLAAGDTFTAYGETITVKGIFESDSKFQNNSIVVPIATLQSLTGQKGAVTSAVATVDSSDNVASTVSSLKSALGDKADITSQEDQAEASLAPLKSIESLATAGVVGASLAGAAIILLSMVMIVRERRREIGVIKAIGGTNAKVIVQFVTEALTLTIIGGIVGIGLGILASGPLTSSLVSDNTSMSSDGPHTSVSGPKSISSDGSAPMVRSGGGPGGFANQIGTNIKDITATLTPTIIAQSIGIVLLIAIAGSAVPAWAIARVRPAEVLRTE